MIGVKYSYMTDVSDYDSVKEQARFDFQKLKPILSPALNEYIHFTAEGFEHIIYKGSRVERDKNSQKMRFKLLPRAVRLLEISTTFQEYEEISKQFWIQRHKKRIQESKRVQYWGIIAIIEGRKIKVIVRKVGNGQFHFWSIVPAWTTNKYRDMKLISTMKGDPSED